MNARFPALFIAAALAGCATPQYQTTVRMVPPTDVAGRTCVQDCEKKLGVCQADCRTRQQTCAQSVEPQVDAQYAEALKRYEVALRDYAAALRHYEMQLRFDWMYGYPYGPYWWHPWPAFPPPVREPVMPTREGVRAALIQKTCQDDCGCLPAFDACFVGCGGQRISETRCIKHCPQGK